MFSKKKGLWLILILFSFFSFYFSLLLLSQINVCMSRNIAVFSTEHNSFLTNGKVAVVKPFYMLYNSFLRLAISLLTSALLSKKLHVKATTKLSSWIRTREYADTSLKWYNRYFQCYQVFLVSSLLLLWKVQIKIQITFFFLVFLKHKT